jgi:hypothetical protein
MAILTYVHVAAAAAGDGLMDRWRDLGPGLWLTTAVLAGIWVAALLTVAALRDPRAVTAAPALLETQGDEPPAVVNLITTDWDLEHEAVPGTLVDLAARRYLDIDMVGDDTFIRLRNRGGGNDLTGYEEMVLDHVRDLASHTPEDRVPAQALTTGPERTAKRWWKRFRRLVVADARGRGLSQARWPVGLKVALVVAAIPVALSAALAGSTLRDQDETDADANTPVENALYAGGWTLAILGFVAASRSGERDTPEGRAAAARWLGLREQLAEDPLFADQPPAAVAIWDRLLAHGTAMGVAHGVAQALPLGTESERDAWSSVGGRWRRVRIRYPRRVPPGYGTHPALAVLSGLVVLAIGTATLRFLPDLVTSFRDDTTVGGEDHARFAHLLSLAGAAATVLAAPVAAVGAWMILAGIADLVSGRTTVEGRILRERDRYRRDQDGDRKLVSRYLAVDDGTADTIRSWRFTRHTVGHRGDTVRGRVTRFLRHAKDLEVVSHSGRSAVDADAAADAAADYRNQTRRDGIDGIIDATVASAVFGALDTLAAARQPQAGAQTPNRPGGGPPPPAPPLPDDAAVSAAAGVGLVRDPTAKPHPAALPDGSAVYRATAAGDAHVQVAWVPADMIAVYRATPALLRHAVPNLGDEAYRARWGGGILARRGDNVVTVVPHLPGLDDTRRDDVATRIAADALARSAPPVAAAPPPGTT